MTEQGRGVGLYYHYKTFFVKQIVFFNVQNSNITSWQTRRTTQQLKSFQSQWNYAKKKKRMKKSVKIGDNLPTI